MIGGKLFVLGVGMLAPFESRFLFGLKISSASFLESAWYVGAL